MSITAIIAIIAMKNRLCTANPDLLWQLRYFSVQKDCASFVVLPENTYCLIFLTFFRGDVNLKPLVIVTAEENSEP